MKNLISNKQANLLSHTIQSNFYDSEIFDIIEGNPLDFTTDDLMYFHSTASDSVLFQIYLESNNHPFCILCDGEGELCTLTKYVKI